MTRAELPQLIERYGFGAWTQVLLAEAREAIRIDAPATPRTPLGCSKIGGRPDLPVGSRWPHVGPYPSTFIAQIRLSELHAVAPTPLPARGRLWFWLDELGWSHGRSPLDWGQPGIVFEPDESRPLERLPFPEAMNDEGYGSGKYRSCRMSFTPTVSLPYPDRIEPHGFRIETSWEIHQYFELLRAALGNRSEFVRHQILGYPEGEHWELVECECLRRGWSRAEIKGFFDGNSPPPDGSSREAIEQAADNWRLLLQISSNDDAEMCFSDAGTLMWFIRDDDLAALDFSKAQLQANIG